MAVWASGILFLLTKLCYANKLGGFFNNLRVYGSECSKDFIFRTIISGEGQREIELRGDGKVFSGVGMLSVLIHREGRGCRDVRALLNTL